MFKRIDFRQICSFGSNLEKMLNISICLKSQSETDAVYIRFLIILDRPDRSKNFDFCILN
jgi:hypothetical protein